MCGIHQVGLTSIDVRLVLGRNRAASPEYSQTIRGDCTLTWREDTKYRAANATVGGAVARHPAAPGDSPWLRVEFRTMSVPEAPASIRCVEERPDAVVLEWRVSEEVGAEVTACQVQISGSIWWQDAKFAEGPWVSLRVCVRVRACRPHLEDSRRGLRNATCACYHLGSST